jgi:Protein involved in formate dehydrogenase formation
VSAEAAALDIDGGAWETRRARAQELRERHPYAAELLKLYLALLPAQEQAWTAVRERAPDPRRLAAWAAAQVLPSVARATEAAGPAALREAVRRRLATATAEDGLAGWLAGADLAPVDRYLARATLRPALEALGDRAADACTAQEGADGAICPRCGGPPQVSCVAATGESLVSGGRSLLCARCGSSWTCSRSVCPACGESAEGRLTTYAERWGSDAPPLLPHLRIAACETCRRYLIEVDLERDARAVPEVDELVALPLDLHATDQGLAKVTPNLMGF